MDYCDTDQKPELELGPVPGNVHIGILALANDQVIERDMRVLLPRDVATYTTRLEFAGDCSLENLSTLGPQISQAASLLNSEITLNAVIFGCTSGTIALGADKIEAFIHRTQPGVLCLNPLDSAVAALRKLKAERIAFMTPYTMEVAKEISFSLVERGFILASQCHLSLELSADISRVTPQSIYDHAMLIGQGESDALFISCTDFQSMEVIEQLEADLGKPVVTSNQALVWRILQQLSGR